MSGVQAGLCSACGAAVGVDRVCSVCSPPGVGGDVVARAKAALVGVADGPWRVESEYDPMTGSTSYHVVDIEQFRGYRNNVYCGVDKALAEFIAASRDLVPELVAEVESLRESLYNDDEAAR